MQIQDCDMSWYLREISKIKFLTAEQEKELGAIIQRDNKIRGQEWQDARNRLCEANLRYVVSVAKKYIGRGLPLNELVQMGNEGLQEAAAKFDPTRGFRFKTYATWWIRQRIQRSISDTFRTIRLPVHADELLTKIWYVEVRCEEELGRLPNNWEVVLRLKPETTLGTTKGQGKKQVPVTIADLLEKVDKINTNFKAEFGYLPTPEQIIAQLGQLKGMVEHFLEKIKELRRFKDTISLDSGPSGADSDDQPSLLGAIADNQVDDPEEIAVHNTLRSQLLNALGQLSEKNARIITLRFGLLDGTPWTLQQVAETLGLTRERIRQLEVKALKELKLHIPNLREYLD